MIVFGFADPHDPGRGVMVEPATLGKSDDHRTRYD